ncbi:lysylphosphatidylglycerol synthase transmembrane domain-containing protein [Actinacidiphila acididurans]|uniref:Flippase-like domain-containing protein n=1 Tax=Actinacidiphila acididurans TaxID=2784346 RepID=A0ABS2U5U7_9ACTN|nr:lysylphosphatidylglycerol synthase domain-containing protein [Actinacidiphila acididurans]MBM9509855.1 flippase-like domain-containing protein [Actinacidiphila acididurans]
MSTAETPPRPGPAWQRSALRRLPWRTIICLVPLAGVAIWAFGHWPTITSGGHDLWAANRYWLFAALLATAFGWVANAVARQGTILEPLPPCRLLATQFAATAASQLAPAGVGAGAVNLRFLRGCGVPLLRTSAAIALYSIAESVGRVTLLAVLLIAFPHALHLHGIAPGRTTLLFLAAATAIALVAAVLTLALVRPLRRIIRDFLAAARTDVRSLHMRPARALALWGGSLAFPATQAAGLIAVSRALSLPVPAGHVAVAYLAATCVAAGIPAPGGVGSVDAALGLALVAAGAPATTATSAVLGFRIISAWLPLLPAALVLAALVRRKVV